MKTNQTGLKRIAGFGLLLMMGVSMSTEAGLFGHTMKWKEEVLLHDGSKIVIKVDNTLGGRPTLESRERTTIEETVTFTLPGTNREIIWKMGFRDDVPEPNSLNLILLDIVKGVPYIATYPAGCIAYNKWKRPNPPQVLFKYEGEQWKRITLAEFPAELINAHANVVVGRPATSLLKPFYTVEQVNAENHDIHEAAYKTILREPYPGAGGGCEPMVHYKCGWVGANPDGTFNKEFMDRMCK